MENKELQIIKKVVPTTCPECGKEIFCGFQSMIPTLTSIVTKKDMDEAKTEIRKRLSEIKFKEDGKLKEILGWLDKDNTFVDGSDIEDFLRQIVLEQSPLVEEEGKK
jgi:hypothetical protein